ncbi:MAG: type II toxin-antitoxin system VapB family antitoxin [Verrucomicrobiales bacterium]|nr:type II toxin-antitoxin system VapB family antitoxin [Verrucomicrobiales bacterium]
MRISVEIDESILADAMELTGESSRSPALAKAVTEFVRRKRAQEFGRLMREGAFDYPSVMEEPPAYGADPGNPIPPLIKE